MRTRGVRLGAVMAIAFLAGSAGCLGPQVLRDPAKHNAENVGNYNANVAKLAAAFRHQAALQGELQVQIARGAVSRKLLQMRKLSLSADVPNATVLNDETVEPHKTLKAEYELAANGSLSTPAERETVELSYPLVADMVLGKKRKDIPSIILDAFAVEKLNQRILAETNDSIAALLHEQRNRILDQYSLARREKETVAALLEAIDAWLKDLESQADLAATHAQTFVNYAQATPALQSLAGAFGDKELRAGLVERVREFKGENAAHRVEDMLGKSDKLVSIIQGLRGG